MEVTSEVIRSASTKGRVYCDLCGRLANKAQMVGPACSDCLPFGEVIFSYTRAQAIEDGVLADLSELTHYAGIKFPVAMTLASYQKCVAVPAGCESIQDGRERAVDVLTMLKMEIAKARSSSSTIFFFVMVMTKPDTTQAVRLKALCGPGDKGEPVITIMFPEED